MEMTVDRLGVVLVEVQTASDRSPLLFGLRCRSPRSPPNARPQGRAPSRRPGNHLICRTTIHLADKELSPE